jgi:hypothetical protein
MFMRKCFNRSVIPSIILMIACAGTAVAMDEGSSETWEDSATGLVWTVKDNGTDEGYNQAFQYCERLELNGYTDWSLPTIEELMALFDKSLDKKYKIKGPIELGSPSVWSGSMNASGDVWSYYFNYGGKSLSPTRGCGTVGRAICVHRPESK